jgi:hypothetical protein
MRAAASVGVFGGVFGALVSDMSYDGMEAAEGNEAGLCLGKDGSL